MVNDRLYLQADSTTWEIYLGMRLRVKVVLPNIFNSECISAEWPIRFEQNAFEILHTTYIQLSFCAFQQSSGVIGNAPVYCAKSPGSRLTRATVFFFNFIYI